MEVLNKTLNVRITSMQENNVVYCVWEFPTLGWLSPYVVIYNKLHIRRITGVIVA